MYSLTKFGVNAFSEGIRQELIGKRVRVGIVEPGTVQTEITEHLPPQALEAQPKLTAGMVKLRPEDIADAVRLHRHARPEGGRQRDAGSRRRADLVNGRWVTGEASGLSFPADPDAFRDGDVTFLTKAFHASGVLDADNAVIQINRCQDVSGGSTGRKMLLDVTYRAPQPDLHTDLFVKFSRDFDDPVRDRGRTQMDSEIKFASLSLTPGFPIAVPRAQFADYHRDTGTGILISQRIRFGANGIERQHHKCLDYEMPRPVEHYRALLTAVARLAGAHRSGRLPARLTDQFPVDLRAATVGEPPPLTPDKLHRRIARLAEFAEAHPRLAARQRAIARIPRPPDRGGPARDAAGVRRLALPRRRARLHRPLPLERQRRQRMVLE